MKSKEVLIAVSILVIIAILFVIYIKLPAECDGFKCDKDGKCYSAYPKYCFKCLGESKEKCACYDNNGNPKKDDTSCLKTGICCSGVCRIGVSSCEEKPEPEEIPVQVEGGTLVEDIKKANLVVWIHPHSDDEVYIPGLLTMAMDLGTPASCWNIGGAALRDEPEDNPTKIANRKNVELLNLKEYAYLSVNRFDEIVNKLKEEKPDVVITFEPTNGFGHEQHAKSAVQAKQAIDDSGINTKLYYALAKDEEYIARIGRESIDPGEVTDIIDMDTYSPKAGMTYWEVRNQLFENYATLDYCAGGKIECGSPTSQTNQVFKSRLKQVKTCCPECEYGTFKVFDDCPDTLDGLKHEEYYRRVQ